MQSSIHHPSPIIYQSIYVSIHSFWHLPCFLSPSGRVWDVHGHCDCSGRFQLHLPLVRGAGLPHQHPAQVLHPPRSDTGRFSSKRWAGYNVAQEGCVWFTHVWCQGLPHSYVHVRCLWRRLEISTDFQTPASGSTELVVGGVSLEFFSLGVAVLFSSCSV